MHIPWNSSWENFLLPTDEAFTMDLKKQEEGMLGPRNLNMLAFPVLEPSDSGGISLWPVLLGGN